MKSIGIKYQLRITTLIPVLLVALLFAVFYNGQFNCDLKQHISRLGEAYIHQLLPAAQLAILRDDDRTLQGLIDASTINPEVQALAFYNSKNQLLISGVGMYCDIFGSQYMHLYGLTPNTMNDITNVLPTRRGLIVGWNKSTGGGMTDFVNFGEGGLGGFQFWNSTIANPTVTSLGFLKSNGDLTVNGTITPGNGQLAGNIKILGNLNVNTNINLYTGLTNYQYNPLVLSGDNGIIFDSNNSFTIAPNINSTIGIRIDMSSHCVCINKSSAISPSYSLDVGGTANAYNLNAISNCSAASFSFASGVSNLTSAFKMCTGSVTVASVIAGSTLISTVYSFGYTFASAPSVFIQNSGGTGAEKCIWATNTITTTGFKLNVYNVGTTTLTNIIVSWMAIGNA